MAPWHVMAGVGIGLIATLIAMIAQRYQRAKCLPEPSFFSPPDEICSVCLVNMSNDEMSYLNCGHAVHHECLINLRKFLDKCPICRQSI